MKKNQVNPRGTQQSEKMKRKAHNKYQKNHHPEIKKKRKETKEQTKKK